MKKHTYLLTYERRLGGAIRQYQYGSKATHTSGSHLKAIDTPGCFTSLPWLYTSSATVPRRSGRALRLLGDHQGEVGAGGLQDEANSGTVLESCLFASPLTFQKIPCHEIDTTKAEV